MGTTMRLPAMTSTDACSQHPQRVCEMTYRHKIQIKVVTLPATTFFIPIGRETAKTRVKLCDFWKPLMFMRCFED